ncbi:hypothetical protein AB0J74_33265 [Asanoa sp. NPDC049573]|uniref:hypothetical protein n=1 Tax=Asanoa sp. NPDC049573 TaxID=3155396 RepID=UPI0034347946
MGPVVNWGRLVTGPLVPRTCRRPRRAGSRSSTTMHDGGEIGVLRDLYRAGLGAVGGSTGG